MRVHAWDTAFVRARRADVHALVHDPAAAPRWWPGLRAEAAAGGWVRYRLGGGLAMRRLAVDVRMTRHRPDKGIHLAVRGDFDGVAEWYYLDEVDGTTVHHILDAATRDRGARPRLERYRASVRRGLHGVKDLLEGGRLPGEEPDPALLAHQRAVAGQLAPPARVGRSKR